MGNHTTKYNIVVLELSKSCFGEDQEGNSFSTSFDKIKTECLNQESWSCSIKSKDIWLAQS